LEKEMEKQRMEEEEATREKAEEEKERSVREFEKVMMGLEGGAQSKKAEKVGRDEDDAAKENRGTKRKFELDEEEMLKNAKEERATARRALDDEKVLYLSTPTTPLSLTITRHQNHPSPPSGSPLSPPPPKLPRPSKPPNSIPSAPPPPKALLTTSPSNP
jgi:hypothetical protein